MVLQVSWMTDFEQELTRRGGFVQPGSAAFHRMLFSVFSGPVCPTVDNNISRAIKPILAWTSSGGRIYARPETSVLFEHFSSLWKGEGHLENFSKFVN